MDSRNATQPRLPTLPKYLAKIVLVGSLFLLGLVVGGVGTVFSLDVAAGAGVATRHVRRGSDLPGADQGAALLWGQLSLPGVGVTTRVQATAVIADRDAPHLTRDLDEVAAILSWGTTAFLGSATVRIELGVDGRLYPRRVRAGYGALVVEPYARIGLPEVVLAPSLLLVFDTTPLQQGWYWSLDGTLEPKVRRQPILIHGRLGWVESYRKQDTPDLVPTTQAAGIVGFLAALAPAIATVEVRLPLALGDEMQGRQFVIEPFVEATLVSPFVQAINEDGGDIVLGIEFLFRQSLE